MRLEVSSRCDLAVRALRALGEPGPRVKGPELAATVGCTAGFLSQVLTPLVRAGWVRSGPGPSGGYRLSVRLTDIPLLAVVEAVEGPTDTGRCVLADSSCDARATCALHVPWMEARSRLLRELRSTSVADTPVIDAWSPPAIVMTAAAVLFCWLMSSSSSRER